MGVRPKAIVTVALMLLSVTVISVTAEDAFSPSKKRVVPIHDCFESENLTCEGRVFYINPVHHVASFQEPNIARTIKNAVRFVSPYTLDAISVLVFANTNDHAQTIFDLLSGEPDMSPVKTTNQNDLLSLSAYNVIIVQSNGVDFDVSVEQSISDFAGRGGGVIGGHDIIWSEFNNPILYDVFGAEAYGNGSVPGDGWVKGTVTVLKAIDHPITTGIANNWNLFDEQYFFNVEFKRKIVVVLETNHSGKPIPVGWTLTLPRMESPTNLTAEVVGTDIRLEWDNPNASEVAYHLIYRAESPDGFDFTDPVKNTSGDIDPVREEWTDAGAAGPFAPQEYYYIVRAVNQLDMKSPTSITVGKWTRHFREGLNAFSLPLMPHIARTVSWFANDIPNTRVLDWLDSGGRWIRYDLNSPNESNDTATKMGSTYQLILDQETDYTFVGLPGTMIRFIERLGNSTLFLRGLTLEIQGSNAVLSWKGAYGAINYHVYRSTTREGLHDSDLSPIHSTPSTQFVDWNVLSGFKGELYYIVVAQDDYCGNGSSTYSIGLAKQNFTQGFSSFALELVPLQHRSLDWYSSSIDGVEGIAYVVSSVWKFHSEPMPEGVYDTFVEMSYGYQISIKCESAVLVYVGR